MTGILQPLNGASAVQVRVACMTHHILVKQRHYGRMVLVVPNLVLAHSVFSLIVHAAAMQGLYGPRQSRRGRLQANRASQTRRRPSCRGCSGCR